MREREGVCLINRIILLPINNWDTIIEGIKETLEISDSSVLKLTSQLLAEGYKIESASDLKQALLVTYSKKSGYDLTLDIISFHFDIEKEKIMLHRDKGLYGYSKQLAIFFMYYHNDMDKEAIAKIFSIKESTVRYSVKKVKKYIELPVYKKDIKSISEYLGAKIIYYKLLAKNLRK